MEIVILIYAALVLCSFQVNKFIIQLSGASNVIHASAMLNTATVPFLCISGFRPCVKIDFIKWETEHKLEACPMYELGTLTHAWIHLFLLPSVVDIFGIYSAQK